MPCRKSMLVQGNKEEVNSRFGVGNLEFWRSVRTFVTLWNV